MREENRSVRQQQIEAAAYEVLEARGYAGTSMLGIARKARASNETLYNWYGDKAGLFRSLAEANAQAISDELAGAIAGGRGKDALERASTHLIAMLLGPRAIALNQAAAGDPTGDLGRAIATGGRDRIAPMVGALITSIWPHATGADVETFLALLIGDTQIRRAIGVLPDPSPADCAARAARAVAGFATLMER